jgi:predicted Fe-Mo cluster-binding NifX family protein
MKVAIATEGNRVSAHFGRCASFTLVDIEDGELVNRELVPNPGHAPGAVPRFLQERDMDWVIAGGMGRRAAALFDQAGVRAVTGVEGAVDRVVEEVLAGTLEGGEELCSGGHGGCEEHRH